MHLKVWLEEHKAENVEGNENRQKVHLLQWWECSLNVEGWRSRVEEMKGVIIK